MLTRKAQMRFFFFTNSLLFLLFCLLVTPTKASAPAMILWGPLLPTSESKKAADVTKLQASIGRERTSAIQASTIHKDRAAVQVSRNEQRTAVRSGKARISKRDIELLSRLVYAEGRGEPYEGQVAIAAVVLNRVESPQFPNTVPGVIFARNAFSPVQDGQLSHRTNDTARKAVMDAINGKDPSGGALYFFNPKTATSDWIWSRKQTLRIANHVFAH
ncbi:cell wall hydrolase [Brevibacillus composti]|nr:cell wall hydrolase [Brevibacillus composti]